jgi:hypothetical protein
VPWAYGVLFLRAPAPIPQRVLRAEFSRVMSDRHIAAVRRAWSSAGDVSCFELRQGSGPWCAHVGGLGPGEGQWGAGHCRALAPSSRAGQELATTAVGNAGGWGGRRHPALSNTAAGLGSACGGAVPKRPKPRQGPCLGPATRGARRQPQKQSMSQIPQPCTYLRVERASNDTGREQRECNCGRGGGGGGWGGGGGAKRGPNARRLCPPRLAPRVASGKPHSRIWSSSSSGAAAAEQRRVPLKPHPQ